MIKKTKPTHKIELTEEHLELIAQYIEATHRAICGQYDFLIDLIKEKTGAKISYEEKQQLENILKEKTHPNLEWNASYGGDFDALGYQTYRDILEYFEEERDKERTEEQKNSFLKSVYAWKQGQIAKEPKLIIKKLNNLA